VRAEGLGIVFKPYGLADGGAHGFARGFDSHRCQAAFQDGGKIHQVDAVRKVLGQVFGQV
jgi:hypothetical protein